MHTPSYSGSHVSGYNAAIEALVRTLAKKTEPSDKLNLITGWVNPGDVTALKGYLAAMGIQANVLLDTESFDAPTLPGQPAFAEGSTTWEDLADSANAVATVALSRYEGASAASWLHEKHKVPAVIADTPIGIANTDALLQHLSRLTGRPIPESLVRERGQARTPWPTWPTCSWPTSGWPSTATPTWCWAWPSSAGRWR